MEKRRSEELGRQLEGIRKNLKSTTLIAVSKFRPLEDLICAYELSQRDFGENRVQELKEKAFSFQEKGLTEVRWHFIGHLQTNKINTLLKIPNLTYIHSVSSLRLLEELYKKENLLEGKKIKFFIEVKTSGEEEKQGIETKEELDAVLNLIEQKKDSSLVFEGLMTMGTIRTDDLLASAKECFQKLKKMKNEIEEKSSFKNLKLSMGMSQDYEVALSEGSDFIRVGTAIFKSELPESI